MPRQVHLRTTAAVISFGDGNFSLLWKLGDLYRSHMTSSVVITNRDGPATVTEKLEIYRPAEF